MSDRSRALFELALRTPPSDFNGLVRELKSAFPSFFAPPSEWTMTSRKYNQLRWYAHWAKVYREAPRKLRKCEMRAMVKRRKSERKRYI